MSRLSIRVVKTIGPRFEKCKFLLKGRHDPSLDFPSNMMEFCDETNATKFHQLMEYWNNFPSTFHQCWKIVDGNCLMEFVFMMIEN